MTSDYQTPSPQPGSQNAARAIWNPSLPGATMVASVAVARHRRRGLLQGAAGVAAGAAFLLLHRPVPAMLAGTLGWIVIAAALAAPARLQRFFEGSATAVGSALAVLLLAPLYLLLFFPFGLLFRSGKRDRLERSLDREAVTYWRAREGEGVHPSSAAAFDRQF